ncbi:MAG TPA: FaeA/PapI family transcriptional regulator, partial [Burkholderiaceae bacterium]|nr:FaeA/PapI family transcriptional regulator [Burkholderiaceae bacterium]
IYALADASLVVSSDLNKGGTWTGAVEQLDKLKFVPVYVRSTGGSSPGLDALRSKGAVAWPNPQDADVFESVFDAAAPTPPSPPEITPAIEAPSGPVPPSAAVPVDKLVEPTPEPAPSAALTRAAPPEATGLMATATSTPADTLFAAVRNVIPLLLKSPMKEAEVAAALDVSTSQAKAWLQRLTDEGAIEKKTKKPLGYVVKQRVLFE